MIITDSQNPEDVSRDRKVPLTANVPPQGYIDDRIPSSPSSHRLDITSPNGFHRQLSATNLYAQANGTPHAPNTPYGHARDGSWQGQGTSSPYLQANNLPGPNHPGHMYNGRPNTAPSSQYQISSSSYSSSNGSTHSYSTSSGGSGSQDVAGPVISPTGSFPAGNPPGYAAARFPAVPVKYSFSQLSFNSMILVPPETSPDTRPVYHISVHLNCFMPFSFVTVVNRGGSENGEHVGEFELGINAKSATLYMAGEEVLLNSVLSKTKGSHSLGRWSWKRRKVTLVWNCEGVERICHPQDQPHVFYAKFFPSNKLRRPNQPPNLSELEIFPAGTDLFDDILMSALVIERQRLTPSGSLDSHKNLFNYKSVTF